ncbi:hypothetical protein [Agromyces sp. NPDC058064]
MIQAIRSVDPDGARRATTAHIESAVEWLIDEKARLETPAPLP